MDTPEQRWKARVALKSGLVFDTIVRHETAQALLDPATKFEGSIVVEGFGDNGWPTYWELDPLDISLTVLTPHEAYLAGSDLKHKSFERTISRGER